MHFPSLIVHDAGQDSTGNKESYIGNKKQNSDDVVLNNQNDIENANQE